MCPAWRGYPPGSGGARAPHTGDEYACYGAHQALATRAGHGGGKEGSTGASGSETTSALSRVVTRRRRWRHRSRPARATTRDSSSATRGGIRRTPPLKGVEALSLARNAGRRSDEVSWSNASAATVRPTAANWWRQGSGPYSGPDQTRAGDCAGTVCSAIGHKARSCAQTPDDWAISDADPDSW
jgi:hypothetical protein